jgi:Xylose isomerase-like TIM barrel.
MIESGLVSVTFRKLSPGEIIELVTRAGLNAIEWGGDIHVPHGDLKKAKEVAGMTLESGLKISSYGSYYHVGCENDLSLFERILETASILKAPTIRVWAGNKGTSEADEDHWERVVEDARAIVEKAAAYDIELAFEYHGNSLTDNINDALKLLDLIGNRRFKSYWQPNIGMEPDKCRDDIIKLKGHLSNIHVFHWINYEHRSLSEGEFIWDNYFKTIDDKAEKRFASLEFVRDDSPEAFLEDAKTLKKLLEPYK